MRQPNVYNLPEPNFRAATTGRASSVAHHKAGSPDRRSHQHSSHQATNPQPTTNCRTPPTHTDPHQAPGRGLPVAHHRAGSPGRRSHQRSATKPQTPSRPPPTRHHQHPHRPSPSHQATGFQSPTTGRGHLTDARISAQPPSHKLPADHHLPDTTNTHTDPHQAPGHRLPVAHHRAGSPGRRSHQHSATKHRAAGFQSLTTGRGHGLWPDRGRGCWFDFLWMLPVLGLVRCRVRLWLPGFWPRCWSGLSWFRVGLAGPKIALVELAALVLAAGRLHEPARIGDLWLWLCRRAGADCGCRQGA